MSQILLLSFDYLVLVLGKDGTSVGCLVDSDCSLGVVFLETTVVVEAVVRYLSDSVSFCPVQWIAAKKTDFIEI